VLIRENGGILAGHGRVMAAELLGLSEVPAIVLGHLSDAQARAYILADNKLAESPWDMEALAAEIADLHDEGFDMELTGFSPEEVGEFLDGWNGGEDEEPGEGGEKALNFMDFGVDPPRTKVEQGDTLSVGPHTLVCGPVFRGVAAWRGLLDDDMVFLPYPGPFALSAEKLRGERCLLVQPDPVIAGYIVDIFEDTYGGEEGEG
jgi:hypothetical protein